MKLNVSGWKEFSVEQLFYIRRGKTLSSENKNMYQGNIPCVNGSSEHNGVFCYLAKEITEIGFELQKAPALSLARVGNAGKTFVQSSDFFLADNAFSLVLKENQEILAYLFISTILNMETVKYSYGRTVSMEKYKKLSIRLPVRANGEPDFGFMVNYIKTLHSKPVTTVLKEKQLILEIDKWHSYRMGSLFDFRKGKRLTKADMIPGKINYLGAVSENNGVREKIEVCYHGGESE